LQFSGLVQLKEHADSEYHKQVVDFFKMEDDTTTGVEKLEENSSSVKDDILEMTTKSEDGQRNLCTNRK